MGKPIGKSWPEYVEEGVRGRLIRAGERWGISFLVYNPLVFRLYHRFARKDAPAVMRTFAELFPDARRFADVGSGSGAFAAQAIRDGLQVRAYEHSPFGRLFARTQGVKCQPFDLNNPPEVARDSVDLAYCFEVAEHIPANLGMRLVHFLTIIAPVVVFTAAYPGQGGTGHVNEQPQSYWIGKFLEAGLSFDQKSTALTKTKFSEYGVHATWLIDNVMVFQRPKGKGLDVVP
jgi:SAM-dependent methyltransferase